MAVPSILVAVMVNAVAEKYLVAYTLAGAVYRGPGVRGRQYFLRGVAVACGKQRAGARRRPHIGCKLMLIQVTSAFLFQL
jgi:hypothetical protein